VTSSPQINLDLTDSIYGHENDIDLQHDCLHVAASIEKGNDPRQVISYCMSELPSKWDIQANNRNPVFTFAELFKRNISSEQLYLWSAPMDIIQSYQFYLNQVSNSNYSSSLATRLFYNCTSPRFGPLCQYSFDDSMPYHSSLNEIISDYYRNQYNPTSLTCYIHLVCNRGSGFVCLDWSEICDGIIDCENGIDEQHCWQLEINECKDNEYRCNNGQCIPKIFLDDSPTALECLDGSDVFRNKNRVARSLRSPPTITTEDVICSRDSSASTMKLTSSCVLERNKLIFQAMFDGISNALSYDCWSAIKCKLRIAGFENLMCEDLCQNGTCESIIHKTCPNIIPVPASPVAFGHMYFVYTNEDLIMSNSSIEPAYVCYNEELCGGFYPNRTLVKFGNDTCRRPQDFPLIYSKSGRKDWLNMYVKPLYEQLYQCNTIINHDSGMCNNLNMYRCINSSKCISIDRLCDKMKDCDYGDDEQCSLSNEICSLYGSKILFKCRTTNQCISRKLVNDNICDCPLDEYSFCDDEMSNFDNTKTQISFPTICDGFTDLLPVLIDGREETDETECQYWPCNNIYTRCDGFWNCPNGDDEVDCEPSPLLRCPQYSHVCVSPVTNQLMCLPAAQVNSAIIDCLGATDESRYCRATYVDNRFNFQCITESIPSCIKSDMLCDGIMDCPYGDDERFCVNTRNFTTDGNLCDDEDESFRTDVENFFCRRQFYSRKPKIGHFSLGAVTQSSKYTTKEDTKTIIPRSNLNLITRQYQQHCHRGLPLRVWLDDEKNTTTTTCLCPPSYYGDQCQYQNQRVSLTLQFQTLSQSRRTPLAVVVSLIDDTNERIVHSHQQFTYLPMRESDIKLNTYLLYSTRPKDESKQYSIHIDVYEKMSLYYRGSFLVPVSFPFLPVQRISVRLNIPSPDDNSISCSDSQCVHGQCIRYFDDPKSSTFCQCHAGWSGRYCTIQHNCMCSTDSLCLGILPNGRSVCVCPIHKWGSQCLLESTVCDSGQNLRCYNGGQCIPLDQHIISEKKFTCICPDGFSGERCEIADTDITMTFNKNIALSQFMFIYFVRVIDNAPPKIDNICKTIPSNQNSITVRRSEPFHIAFAELFLNNYFLITVQPTSNQAATILREIQPSDRCQHLSEVLNNTIASLHLLRRIKYYHLPCQRDSSQLSCFYDEFHFCLCEDGGRTGRANCFAFDHARKSDFSDQSDCKNVTQPFQNNSTQSWQNNQTRPTYGNGAQIFKAKLYAAILIILLFMFE
jgi:hypothetical protein